MYGGSGIQGPGSMQGAGGMNTSDMEHSGMGR